MNIGDYVRTKNGYISKVENIVDDFIWFDNTIYKSYSDSVDTLDKEDINKYIVKSSPNIIDLIEENDIVNHSRVVCIGVSTDLSGIHKYLVLENRSNCANGNIKSIVTKEQFESMEYKL